MTLICLLYPSLKTFYSLFQIAILFLVSLTAKSISSPDTPATAPCKEIVLMALHNSFLIVLLDIWTAVAQWLRCCATNRKVAGSIPDGVIGVFH